MLCSICFLVLVHQFLILFNLFQPFHRPVLLAVLVCIDLLVLLLVFGLSFDVIDFCDFIVGLLLCLTV